MKREGGECCVLTFRASTTSRSLLRSVRTARRGCHGFSAISDRHGSVTVEANGPENAFHNETTPGSSVLQVSNGVTTAELPITPIA